MQTVFLLLLAATVATAQCTFDFATSTTFDTLIGRSRYSLLLAYNPQAKGTHEQLKEIISFYQTSRATYEGTSEAVYCPHVIVADGVSFDPLQEKAFNVISPHVKLDEGKDLATVHQLQALGVLSVPSLLLLRAGKIISEWEASLSTSEMMRLFRAVVDADLEKAGLITVDDVLQAATDVSRRHQTTLLVPHLTPITDSLRRDIYSVNATIMRPAKGSTASKVLFSDKAAAGGRLSIYAIGPVGSIIASAVAGTEIILDSDWVPSQWSRRLTERGLTILRGYIERGQAQALGSNASEAAIVLSLVVPPVLEGYTHFGALSAAHRRRDCTVAMFIKDAAPEHVEVYRQRLLKVAAMPLSASAPEKGSLGEHCTFLVANPDTHTRYFTSFGFMFRSLYRNAKELKALPSSHLLPQARNKYSDNLIGIEFSHRKYHYQEAWFNAPLLAQSVRKVLNGKALRVRKVEQFGSTAAVSYATKPHNQLLYPFADSDTLYYEVVRDFRRDSIIVMLPAQELRGCLSCNDDGNSCQWTSGCSAQYGKQLLSLNGMLKQFDAESAKEVGVFYYVTEDNDLTQYLKEHVAKDGGIQLLFVHRSDKLEYFKSQPVYQPGVHAQHLEPMATTIRASSISLTTPLDQLVSFIKESSEALDAHVKDVPYILDEDSEEF